METIIQKALKVLLDKYGADYDCVTVSEDSGHYRVNIETASPPKLIGKNGSILNALQMLLKSILWAQNEEKVFFSLDVDGYRTSQYDKTFDKVKMSIEMMKNEALPEVMLRPMKPYMRRMVHLWVANNYPELSSDSKGEEPRRCVRIFYR